MSLREPEPGSGQQTRTEQRNGRESDETRDWADVFSAGVRLMMKRQPDLSQRLYASNTTNGSMTVNLAEAVVNAGHQDGLPEGTVDPRLQSARTIVSYLAGELGLRTEPMRQQPKQ